MYSFKNDYAEGTHPDILQKLLETNLVQHTGYGEDAYCSEAKELLKSKVANPDANVTTRSKIFISCLLEQFMNNF
ncbi:MULTISPECIES: hypothetical protein [unclassified Sphingobacterium]|uniref:hypothetical protein n=1 Tax=unclassified Sphingobacterium TaxID=2609468 RepID=UPI0020C38FDD|nr:MULTISPECIES: hypothetical protein [unclassified Sphingobacterium]